MVEEETDGGSVKSPFVIKDVNLLLWQMFILTFPFYLLPSGLPRISDFFLVAIAIRLLVRGHFKVLPESRIAIKFLWLFVGYVFLNNSFYALKLTDSLGVQTFLFYIHNGMSVALVFVLYSEYGKKFLLSSYWAISVCVVLQFVLGIRDIGNPARATIFFNNPNQLGYFSLIAAAMVAYLARVAQPKTWQVTGLFFICLMLSLISLSKAAIVGVLIMLVFYGLRQPGVLAIIVAIGFALFTAFPDAISVLDRAEARLSGIGTQADDNAEGRGYNRIWENAQYLAFGASEADQTRWTRSGRQELHSVFGTLIFAYGFIGCALIGTFFYFCLRGQGYDAYPFISIASYGFTHQGLRFTLLWTLLAVSWCVAAELRKRPQPEPTGNPDLALAPA
ncbi:hypothetical protein MCEMSE15_02566 [Fimbriimonadaceae bacterium]